MRKSSALFLNDWLNSGVLNDEEIKELKNATESEIEDRFYQDLEFGTAGMRGVIGMGTNRMNIYTVRRAAQGMSAYVKSVNGEERGVVIGYDTRYFSEEFARETARVLVANGIKAYLFDVVHATPEVSFGIRYYKAAAGVMITASHNPKEYNGFKAYGEDGGQFPPEASDLIGNVVNSYDIFKDVKIISDSELDESPLFNIIGKEADEAFLEAVLKQSINPDVIREVSDDFKLIYTPLHGTGLRPVTEILKRTGVKNFTVEPKQAIADPAFPTVKSPNPENQEAFLDAIELAKANDASLVIGTDPDADRVGIVVRDSDGNYQTLTGNQIGALLCEYVLSAKKKNGTLNNKSTIIKTIVTSELIQAIADEYGVILENVLTGFKYIAQKIANYEKTGSNEYVFGFEESHGYLPGTYARDKDAVGAVMLISEMAASYKKQGMTLYDGLMDIYKRYGFYKEKTISVTMPGKDGMEKMKKLTEDIRKNPPTEFGGIKVKVLEDYETLKAYGENGETELKGFVSSDVLKFKLSDNKSFVVIRPSGTEPKIKLYLGTATDSLKESEEKIAFLEKEVRKAINL
mgnify:CR=1 FL=1